MRLSLCLMIACTLAAPSVAQPVRTNPGAAQDYIVLRQPQRDHDVVLRVRPADPSVPPNRFQWERWEPNGPGYTEARRIRWSATASCASGLDRIQITGPGGTEPQTFGGSRNAISGHTTYDSFDAAALDRVCTDWARQETARCGENPMTEPGCRIQADFAFGPTAPLPRSAPITVSGTCVSGNLPTRSYVPRLQLTCILAN